MLINIHHVDLALDYADRVIGIRQGEIVYDGPAAAVDESVLAQIYAPVAGTEEGRHEATL